MHTKKAVAVSGMPSPLARRAVGTLVIAHLAAIGVAVTSFSSPGFPAPQLAARAAGPLQPYLQATFLNNAYRFFAPNPGTPTVLWFRVQYQDRSVRWVEVPGRSDVVVRAPYQRRLNLAVQFGAYVVPDPTGGDKKTLAPVGETLLQSAVRHVAWAYPQDAADGSVQPVRSVGVYAVLHGVVLPEQARAGWEPTDLRTYRPTFVGAYTADGERVDEFRPTVVDQPIAHVTAGIVEVDVLPRLREPGGDRDAVLAALSLPEPIHGALIRHPELLAAAPGDDLKRRVEALTANGAGVAK
ncbi:MAG: hypothetical protein U0746_14870 [Gemmataceae bacterium]